MTYDAVVFDVLGTVVDEESARHTTAAALLTSIGLGTGAAHRRFADEWESLESAHISAVAGGHRSWMAREEISADALHAVADRHPELTIPADALSEATQFSRGIDPWPEAVAAIDAIRAICPVFALTNGSAATMAEMSRRAGLVWTDLITADEVQTFKPNPLMYEQVRVRGDLDPRRTLFIAAHRWDLDAARNHGFDTALVLRPGVDPRAGYDHYVDDLDGVARLLTVTT